MGENQKRWKKKNRLSLNAYRRKWMKENPEKRREYERRYIESHRDDVNKKQREWKRRTGFDRKRNRRIREKVIKKYGGKCMCCGDTTFEFLSFDHKNGRGRQHRKELLQTGQKFMLWLNKNKIQKSIQLLCHNCNQSLGHYGYCPHHPEITRPILHGRKREC